MKTAFYILAIWTMISGVLAITLRSIIRSALALIAFFGGIAALFFSLGAEFLGATQIIVYVGAIAVLILFAIMLTRGLGGNEGASSLSRGAIWGWLTGISVLGALYYSINDFKEGLVLSTTPNLSVADMGRLLMTRYAIPFEVISLLLTAALVGAVVIALEEPKSRPLPPPHSKP